MNGVCSRAFENRVAIFEPIGNLRFPMTAKPPVRTASGTFGPARPSARHRTANRTAGTTTPLRSLRD